MPRSRIWVNSIHSTCAAIPASISTAVYSCRHAPTSGLKQRSSAFAQRSATLLAESAVPLALACYGTSNDLLVESEHREDRFTDESARTLRDHVFWTLRRFAETPDAKLGEIDRLVPGEAEQLARLESAEGEPPPPETFGELWGHAVRSRAGRPLLH